VYNPTSSNVLNNYAYCHALENKDLPRALEMSRKTIEEEPENPTYIDTYAWVLFMLERYEEARAYADKLMAIEGDKGSVEYLHCGDIYAKCGLLDKAVEFWIKAQESGDDSSILKKKIKNRRYYNEKKRKK
jgi:tetratricopeptide (TPR) repeat protein